MSDQTLPKDGFLVILALGLVYMIYVGFRFRTGQDMPAWFSFRYQTGPKMFNSLADTFGGVVVGNWLIGVSTIGLTWLTIYAWRRVRG